MNADFEEIQRILDEFKLAWQSSDAVPDISQFLQPYSGPSQTELLLELIKIDMENRFKRFPTDGVSQTVGGLPINPEVSDYTKRFGVLKSFPEILSELAAARDRIARQVTRPGQQKALVGRSLLIVGLACQFRLASHAQVRSLLIELFSEEATAVELLLVKQEVLSSEDAELLASLADRLLQRRGNWTVSDVSTLLNLWNRSDNELRHYLETYFRLDQAKTQQVDEVCRQLASLETSLLPSTNIVREGENTVGASDDTAWSLSRTKPMSPEEIFSASVTAKQEPFPRRFGDYILQCELGRGGMGVVYQAKQLTAGRRVVALKVIRTDQAAVLDHDSHTELINRFRNEICSTSILDNDYTVKVYDVGEVNSQIYFAMQYVGGKSLADLLKNGLLAPDLAARYVRHIALALSYAHQSNIVHRDVKPHNILINDQNDRAMLADFGLARVNNPDMRVTQTFAAIGTAPYMSPEQIRDSRSVNSLSDIYSLGATLYHLLTGRPPFQAATIPETFLQIEREEVVSPYALNPAIGKDLATITLKCLEKHPDQRYANANALAEDLLRYLNQEPILAKPISPFGRFVRWYPKHARMLLGSYFVVTPLTWVFFIFGDLIQGTRSDGLRLASPILLPWALTWIRVGYGVLCDSQFFERLNRCFIAAFTALPFFFEDRVQSYVIVWSISFLGLLLEGGNAFFDDGQHARSRNASEMEEESI